MYHSPVQLYCFIETHKVANKVLEKKGKHFRSSGKSSGWNTIQVGLSVRQRVGHNILLI